MSLKNLDNLSPPPRHVPLPVRCHQRFGGLSQLGWWLALFCTPFFWLFFMDCEVMSWLRFSGPLATCRGTITNTVRCNASEEETPIIENQYTYAVNEKQYKGRSYSTGSKLTANDTVTIEYGASDPSVSRIQGYRSRKFGAGAALVLIFPAICAVLIFFGWRRANKSQRLLQIGIPAPAEYRDREATNTQINDETVYKLFFDFIAADGNTYEVIMRKCENQEFERSGQVLYDPANPTFAMLIEDLPAEVRIDRDGNLLPVSSRRALLVSIVPLLTIAWNALWLWHWLFKM